MDETTSPETEVVDESLDKEVTDEVDTSDIEQAPDDVGDETELPQLEDENEDVEFEGKQYKLPKELKDALLRQADYTRKTQEVAEQRRQIESAKAEFQQQTQIQQQTLRDHAQLIALEQQLQQYDKFDWMQASDTDPVATQKLWFQYQTARQQYEQVARHITEVQQQQFQKQQAELAKLKESGVAELKKEIANWSPELGESIKRYGIEKGGFSEDEMKRVYDPRHVKVLHKAYLYDQLLAKQKQAAKPAPEQQKPITTVKAKSTAAVKDPDKMSSEEWLKWRESQIRKNK